MTPRLAIPALVLAVVTVLVVACSPAANGAGWTFAPVASSAASAEPSASGSPAPSSSASAAPSATAGPSASATPAPIGGDATYTLVEKRTCPDTETFECVTLAVPKDHFAAAGGETWNVTFAIHRAPKTSQGTYVEITGGPGYSGIPSSDAYLDYYSTDVTDVYDMVYLDQRGIGQSGPIQCTDAAAAYYASAARPHVPAERDAAIAAAKTFAAACVTETGVPESDLPFYATRQAVEDLEAVRDYLEVDKLDLYGLSYGTQFVQTYAAAHPEHIATLYVDGPVDLTIDGISYYIEAARSAEDVLIESLADCTSDEACTPDIKGGDALVAYDALAARFSAGPIAFDFPTSKGTIERRELTIADLENAAFGAVYYSYDRLLLQRAIAAASNGDLVPLARMAYGAIGVDPDTLVPQTDPGYSDAMYYAVECQDYAFFPEIADADARVDAWVAAAEAAGINETRLEIGFYGDLPCLFWPTATTDATRPAPILDPPYPVFVLTSTTDPATPIANGMRIFSRLTDGYFVQAVGGPHVIYAWGEACPDDLMVAWLVSRTPPATRVTTCQWETVDPYVPVPPATAAGYDDAMDLMRTTDGQIFNAYDYIELYDADPITAGCDYGGTIAYEPTDKGTKITLTDCAFTADVALTGKGETDDEAGTFELEVSRGDDELRYARDADGGLTVEGTYGGKRVDLQAAA